MLATDMGKHRDYYTRFEEWCKAAEKEEKGSTQGTDGNGYHSWVEARISQLNATERMLLMSMVVKCADLANVVKPVEQAEAWAERIMLEFCAQVSTDSSYILQQFFNKYALYLKFHDNNYTLSIAQPTHTVVRLLVL